MHRRIFYAFIVWTSGMNCGPQRFESFRRRRARLAIPFAATALIAACVTGSGGSYELDSGGQSLCVDGLRLSASGYSVADVLESHVSTRALIAADNGSGPGPLVFVGNIEVDGFGRLGAIAATDVSAIETLDANRAVAEFGPRAREGAILIRLRADEGTPQDPHMKGPERCPSVRSGRG